MATALKLEFNALKFGPPLSLRRPLDHKHFLIPCRSIKRMPSSAVRARRFSNFKEHLTLIKDSEIDSHFKWFSPSKTGVLRLQVGLLGKGKSLQKNLNRIAEVADSSSLWLYEVVIALLRRLDCCISGYSCVDVKRIMEDGEKHFNRLSIEERAKIDEESLVSMNGTKKQSAMSQRANGFNDEYTLIMILVAVGGVHKLPVINSSGDLKEALEKLGSIPTNKIHAVDVIWTPEKKNVTLTQEEVLEYHPLLRPL